MGIVDLTSIGSPDSLNPVMISKPLSSGKIRDTSSSRVTWPLSTHCMAAILVISLVQEAMMKVASRSMGVVGVFGPNAF
jgi:hypothetical protein